MAIGTIITVRAGQLNIGQEGQVMMGALAGALVAIRLPGPGPLVLVLTLVAAALGGAIWAGIAALLRFWRGVDIVISSLLLVFVAGQVLCVRAQQRLDHPGARRRLRPPPGVGPALAPRTPPSTRPRTRAPTSEVRCCSAIALAVVVWLLMTRSRWGFRLRILGLNPVAAHRAGISAAVLGGGAIVLSGAFAGPRGRRDAHRFRIPPLPAFANNIGWTGLLVALVARNNAGVAIVTALLFGALEAGGSFLSTAGPPGDLVSIVQALVVLGVVFPPAFMQLRAVRRERAEARMIAGGAYA